VLRSISQNILTNRGIDLEIPTEIFATLQNIGVLMTKDRIPRPPLFDAPFPEMKPAGTLRREAEWIVNPTFRVIPRNELAFASPRLTQRKTWIEVKPPGYLVPSIYSTNQKQLLRRLRPGKALRGKFSLKQIAPLVSAGILIDSGRLHLLKQNGNILKEARLAFKQKVYVNLSHLFSSTLIAAVVGYYCKFIDSGFLPLGDEQVPRRYSVHNESIARLLHLRLTNLVSLITAQRVKPSFVFFASYAEGAELARHTDRRQCEFTLSLLIDYQPIQKGKSPWPLYLKAPGQMPVAIYQSIGDALLFKGRELAHWRPALRQGHKSTSLFLHYVREDFTGDLE
jgi:hypothetical protein